MAVAEMIMERVIPSPRVSVRPTKKKVVIIGAGPAGLFCADRLAGHANVTIYEAGLPIQKRVCPDTGCKACKICHVLEGEGGAGGFSDGKNTYSLTRGTQMEKDIFQDKEDKWLRYIDEAIVKFAGGGVWFDPLPKPPKEFEGSALKFESYPLRHVGSDGIRGFIKGFADDLRSRDVDIILNQSAYPTQYSSDRRINLATKVVRGVVSDDGFDESDVTVIATGLQGIPQVESLMNAMGSPLSSGPAGFGLRLETDAEILAPIFKRFYDFKLVLEQSSNLTMRSFCCNQNGSVLNERHTDLDIVSVNGHSFLDSSMRTKSSNMAIIAKLSDVSPTPQDFVRSLGRRICSEAGGSAYQPMPEFMQYGNAFNLSYMTNRRARYLSIADLLPGFLLSAFRRFIWELNLIVPVISSTSIIYGPEIKYYGKRVNVDRNWRCKDVENLYVIGSGSGYLDSFVAAALSGIVAAENIRKEVL